MHTYTHTHTHTDSTEHSTRYRGVLRTSIPYLPTARDPRGESHMGLVQDRKEGPVAATTQVFAT